MICFLSVPAFNARHEAVRLQYTASQTIVVRSLFMSRTCTPGAEVFRASYTLIILTEHEFLYVRMNY